MKLACRICKNATETFIDFGKMPIANGFLRKEDLREEYFFELKVAFCPNCTMVQLVEQPAPERMFHDGYPFFTSSSADMRQHFENLGSTLAQRYLQSSEDPFIVEIGSNDGTFLKPFSDQKVRHLGLEPSSNVAQVAASIGVQTRSDFFNEPVASEVIETHGKADLLVGTNVMCHISDLHSVAAGLRRLLKPTGVAIFEDPYLGDVLEKTSYDQFYDEHVFLFSATSLQALFQTHNLELIDIEAIKTHGGSLRYTVAHQGVHPKSKAAQQIFKREKERFFDKIETYYQFEENCANSKKQLQNQLYALKEQNKHVMGYAATSKSTTVIQYCNITPDLISSICDTTPLKQGKLSPGAHIPIVPYEIFKQNPPDAAVLFAWNHKKEIMQKEKDYSGEWLCHVK